MPVLEKIKGCYKFWHDCHEKLPRTQKYSIGNRADKLFIEAIEAIATAVFLQKKEKLPWVRVGIRKLDTIKILLLILWETKSLDDKKYVSLSVIVNETGKMLGGWQGQLQKQNSPIEAGEK